jgi:hypothetical protein
MILPNIPKIFIIIYINNFITKTIPTEHTIKNLITNTSKVCSMLFRIFGINKKLKSAPNETTIIQVFFLFIL